MPKRKKSMVLLVTAAVIALTALPLLYFFRGTDTPDVRLAASVPPATDGSGPRNPAVQVEITPANVQNVIATLTRAESYYRRIVQTRYWSDGASSAAETADIWVTPRAMRIRWDRGENMIITEDRFYLWFGSGNHQSRPITAGLGTSFGQILDEFQGIPGYETVLDLSPAQITEAGTVLKNIDGIYEYHLYLVFENSALGYTDRYYISLHSGLLMAMETFDGDIPVFRMETVSLSLLAPQGSEFILPDGTDVLN